MKTKKYRIGDTIKVLSQEWGKPELVGRTGLVVDIGLGFVCLYFKGWKSGHNGSGKNIALRNANPFSFYDLGSKTGDKIELISSRQLEFDFNA